MYKDSYRKRFLVGNSGFQCSPLLAASVGCVAWRWRTGLCTGFRHDFPNDFFSQHPALLVAATRNTCIFILTIWGFPMKDDYDIISCVQEGWWGIGKNCWFSVLTQPQILISLRKLIKLKIPLEAPPHFCTGWYGKHMKIPRDRLSKTSPQQVQDSFSTK